MFEDLKMTLEYWPIEKLIPYARNPRKNDQGVDKAASWIKEFGFRVPILAKSDGTIVDGHLRLKAAKKLGITQIPVSLADDMTEVQIKAFRLSVNKMSELADWDDDLLKLELEELDNLQYDIDSLGFDDIKIDKHDSNGGLTDPDEVPEVPQNVFGVKRGDIWLLGNHRLMCGDSTDENDVKKLMNGQKADMVFTDPPYGINFSNDSLPKKDFKGVREGLKHNKYKPIIGDYSDFDPSFILDFFDCDDIFVWGINHYADKLPRSTWIVWDRKLNDSADKNLVGDFDLCWSKNTHKMTMIRIPWFGVFGHSKVDDGKNKVHPTQKPVKLAEKFFEKWGNNKQNIVDLFLGSGSTLIACEKTGRTCYGLELDEHYCSVIIKRFQDFSGKQAVREG
jgi:DNA modification methylase